jgi:predicted enzyme related to lactoylglutathione lyase
MSEKKNGPKAGQFCWNELAATNVPAAKKFYTKLLGWKTKPFGKGLDYTLFNKGKDMVGGLMKCPKPGIPAHWVPYVIVADVDATAQKATKLRGKVVLPPCDIPTVGRIAVVRDPQGAVIGIMTPEK